MIVDIIQSPRTGKRFRAYLQRKNGRIEYYDFGLEGARTFIDDRTELERQNYLARHLGNKTEEQLITNVIPSASLLSAYLLWGKSRDLKTNVEYLNNLLRKSSY